MLGLLWCFWCLSRDACQQLLEIEIGKKALIDLRRAYIRHKRFSHTFTLSVRALALPCLVPQNQNRDCLHAPSLFQCSYISLVVFSLLTNPERLNLVLAN